MPSPRRRWPIALRCSYRQIDSIAAAAASAAAILSVHRARSVWCSCWPTCSTQRPAAHLAWPRLRLPVVSVRQHWWRVAEALAQHPEERFRVETICLYGIFRCVRIGIAERHTADDMTTLVQLQSRTDQVRIRRQRADGAAAHARIDGHQQRHRRVEEAEIAFKLTVTPGAVVASGLQGSIQTLRRCDLTPAQGLRQRLRKIAVILRLLRAGPKCRHQRCRKALPRIAFERNELARLQIGTARCAPRLREQGRQQSLRQRLIEKTASRAALIEQGGKRRIRAEV